MKRLLLIVLILLLAACAEAEPTPVPTVAATATAALPPTPTSPPPSPPPEPSPTPLVPAIAAVDQELDENGRLTISRVVATEPGWLVIHASDGDGAVGAVLGVTPIAAGVSSDVVVEIDPLAASPILLAMLHSDGGAADAFEFPGADAPVLVADAPVVDPFAVTLAFTLPAITVSDQAISEEGRLVIDSAYSPDGGFVVIHARQDGTIGPVLGAALLQPGINEDVVVGIPWREGTPTLAAVLYEDNGRTQRLDVPGDDLPLLVNGQLVVTDFDVTYPPDVFVLDQPVIDGVFYVERVVSDGPGYIVVYTDDDGELGPIIGSKRIADGLNEQVEVVVLPSGVSDQLYILLHEDTNPDDDFDFPANDPPIVYQGRLPQPFIFQTNVGNYVVATDQPLGEDDAGETAVVVPYAVVDSPAWVVVHVDDDGQPGDVIGQAALGPGVNRDVVVAITDNPTDTLYAMLHLDGGTVGEFEFPGVDVALQRNRAPISAPFRILE